jgi:hypothetical protein
MHSDNQAQSFARDLLKPGFPFSIRDKNNKRMKIHRKIDDNQSGRIIGMSYGI